METNKTEKYASGYHPNTISSLRATYGHRRKSLEVRNVHASARLTKTTKENLNTILSEMDLSLADFLEKISDGKLKVIENK
jgi:hypothetical protein